MKNIWLILQREVLVRLRKKSFLVITFLTPFLFAAMMVLPMILMRINTGDHEHVAVVDYSNSLYPELTSDAAVSFYAVPDTVSVGVSSLLHDSIYSAVLVIGPTATDNPKDITLFSLKTASLQLENHLSSQLENGIEKARMLRYNIDGLDSILKAIKASVSIRTVTFDEEGGERESSASISALIGYILAFVSYFLIFISGTMVMNGVIEEKNSRIVEVLVSTVRSFELMMGKILGIASVFILQLLIWIVLTLVLAFVAVQFITWGDAQSMIEAHTAGMASGAVSSMSDTFRAEVLGPLANVQFGLILAIFIFFFLFGYLMYAGVFAAVGSAVEEASDASQMTTPITLPLIIAILVTMLAIRTPDSSIVVWFSLIPFTSPVIMPVRVAYGVPMWQVGLSGILLVITFLLLTWIASRIYRRGVLMYGKKYSWKDMWRWFKG